MTIQMIVYFVSFELSNEPTRPFTLTLYFQFWPMIVYFDNHNLMAVYFILDRVISYIFFYLKSIPENELIVDEQVESDAPKTALR